MAHKYEIQGRIRRSHDLNAREKAQLGGFGGSDVEGFSLSDIARGAGNVVHSVRSHIPSLPKIPGVRDIYRPFAALSLPLTGVVDLVMAPMTSNFFTKKPKFLGTSTAWKAAFGK